jgi:photosystem II stability/assembly factor-like uncharacterized protein
MALERFCFKPRSATATPGPGPSGCNLGCPGQRLLSTSDRGKTWQDVPIPLGEDDLMFQVSAVDETAQFVATRAGPAANQILATTDSGQTWQNVPLTNDLATVQSLAARRR